MPPTVPIAHHAPNASRRPRAGLLAPAVLLLVTALTACIADHSYNPRPQGLYLDLQNRTAAVLVAIGDSDRRQAPAAADTLAAMVGHQLQQRVPGIRLLDPTDVTRFQQNNPYWSVTPYGQLLTRLGVQRLLVIDLTDYHLHEPGNPHIWQGAATANIFVAADDAPDPSNPVFAHTASAQFPPGQSLGSVDSNPAAMQIGLNTILSDRITALFATDEDKK